MTDAMTENYRNTRGYAATSVYLVCTLLVASIAVLDSATPLSVAVGALYVVAVLLSFWTPNTKFTFFIAITSSAFIIGIFICKAPLEEMWPAVFNRALSLFVIWVTTFLGLKTRDAEKKLIEMANHDFLTGLLNRRELFNRLSLEVSRVNRTNGPLSIIMIDIDHFKTINDRYGHIAGDMVLKKVAHGLREGIRDYDLICRFGGEEFLVMTPETDLRHATELAERLRGKIGETPIRIRNAPPVTITISAGVASLLEWENVEAMLARADTALYHAKESGRNRVEPLSG